jgi:hypothetical protein
MRPCIRDSDSLTTEEFLAYAEQKAIGYTELENLSIRRATSDPIKDGPPCLQALCRIGIHEGSRNNGLYHLGVYLKKLDPDGRLEDTNRRFIVPPLNHKEVGVVIKSLSRKNGVAGTKPVQLDSP